MGYLRSEIKKLEENLYEVRIYSTSWMFMEQSEHTCKKTIEECEKWLLKKRCKNLNVIEDSCIKKIKCIKNKNEWPALKVTNNDVKEGKNHKL